jgi:hypothetical protein
MASDLVAKVSVLLENGQYKEAVEEIAKGTKNMGKQTDQSAGLMARAFAKVQIALGVVRSGLQRMMALLKKTVTDFMNTAKSTAGLQISLRNTGQDVKRLTKDYKAFASELQKTAGQDDDLTVQLITQATNMGVLESQMKPLITAVTDMTAAGYNSETAMRGLANILQGNVEVLARYLPELRKMKAEGKSTDEIFKFVASRFAGTAETMNKATYSIATLNATLGDMREEFGEGYLQGIKPFMESLQELMDKRDGVKRFGSLVGKVFSVIGEAVIFAAESVQALIKIIKDPQGQLQSFTNNSGKKIEVEAQKYGLKKSQKDLNDLEKDKTKLETSLTNTKFVPFQNNIKKQIAALDVEIEKYKNLISNRKTSIEILEKEIVKNGENSTSLEILTNRFDRLTKAISSMFDEYESGEFDPDKLPAPPVEPTTPSGTGTSREKKYTFTTTDNSAALAASAKTAKPDFNAIVSAISVALDLALELSQALGVEASASAGQFAGLLQSIGSKIPGIAGAIVQALGVVFELTSGLINALETEVDMTTEFTRQREALEDMTLQLNAINQQLRTMKNIVDTINLAQKLGVSGFGEARDKIEEMVNALLKAQTAIGKQFGLTVSAEGFIQDLDKVNDLIEEKTTRESEIIDKLGDLTAIQSRIKKNIFKGEFLSKEDQAAVKSVVDDLVRLKAISQSVANKIVAESAGSFMGVSSDIREWINRAISETEVALKDLSTQIDGLNSAVGNNQELLQRLEELRLFQLSNLSEELALLESDAQVLAAQGADNADNLAGQLDLIDDMITQYEALNDAGQYQAQINDLLVKQANLRKQAEQATADAMKRQLDIVRQLQDTGLFDEQNINDVRKLQSYLQSSGASASEQMQVYQDLNVQQAPAGLRQQYLTQYITVNEAEQENLEQRAFNSLVRSFLGK